MLSKIINIIMYLYINVFYFGVLFIKIWLFMLSYGLWALWVTASTVYMTIMYFCAFAKMIKFILIPSLLFIISVELINRYRYQLIKQKLLYSKQKDNEINDKSILFSEMYENEMKNYSFFMKKHMINDNFFDIFMAYYPDGAMNTRRIKNVIRKYVYNLDPLNDIKIETSVSKDAQLAMNLPKHLLKILPKINEERDKEFSSDVPLTATSVHKTINFLAKKFENIYIITNKNQYNDKLKKNINTPDLSYFIDSNINDWSDLSDVVTYKNFLCYAIDFARYMKFSISMRCIGYHYHDVSPDIRVWEKLVPGSTKDLAKGLTKGPMNQEEQELLSKNEHPVHNVVIIDDEARQSIMTNYHRYDTADNIVYVEIKGFSNYSDFFDIITCDTFNKYSSIDEITKQFVNVFKLFGISKLNLFASRESTIMIPFLLNYYHEKLNKIIVINPIYYPYSFHVFYKSIHNKKLSVHLKPNLIRMFNKLSLMDIYFDKNTSDKKFNRLYSRDVNVDFDKNAELYTMHENLAIVLDMYSHIEVTTMINDPEIQINDPEIQNNEDNEGNE